MIPRSLTLAVGLCASVATALSATAADEASCPCPPPPPPPPHVTGSLGAGLALASGNSDSRTYNLTLALRHDPKQRNVVRLEGLYLRTEQNGAATLDRTWAALRDEYTVAKRLYAFGELSFTRDRFKALDSLWAPTAGLGLQVLESDKVSFAVDAGAGGSIEKLAGSERTTSFALQASERGEWRTRPNVKLFERASGLWKAADLGDAYYRLELGAAISIGKRLQLSLALTSDHKTRPAPGLGKTDTSFVTALVFKLD